MIIVLLALCWAIVLVPSLTRPRFESSPISSVGDFERSMGILASTRYGRQQVPGRWVMVPKGMAASPRTRRQRLIQKRRRIFVRLVFAAAATLVLGLIPPLRSLLLAHLALDVAVAVYVVQLRRWHRAEIERARVLRAMPTARPEEPRDVVSGSA